MVRVLIVEPTLFGYDGITNVMTNYYTYMDHSRIHMDLVTINPVSGKFWAELSKNGSKNYVLPYRNRKPLKYLLALRKILKEGKYQAIHVHGCSATMAVEMLAAKLAGVPVRISHSHNTTCDHIKIDRVLRPLFSRLCNTRFACGEEAGEWMFPGKDFEVISNGVDLDRFQYDEETRENIRKEYHLEGRTVIGHVGRFSLQKNHQKLFDIFADYSKRNPKAKLVLVGDGELKTEMERRADEENMDVLFVGLSNEVEKWLQAMDIMVFPSLFEGLPLGLVEAQAAGLPCLLSDTISPGAKIIESVEFLSLNKSPETWGEEIDRLLGKADRKSDREKVRKSIQEAHFDIRKNCRELAERYIQLISTKGFSS